MDDDILVPVQLKHNLNKCNVDFVQDISCDDDWYLNINDKSHNGKSLLICNKDPEVKNVKLNYIEIYVPSDNVLLYKQGDQIKINSQFNMETFNNNIDQKTQQAFEFGVVQNEWIVMEDVPITLKPTDRINVYTICRVHNDYSIKMQIPFAAIYNIDRLGLVDEKDTITLIIGPIATKEEDLLTINNELNVQQIAGFASLVKVVLKPVTKIVSKGSTKVIPKIFSRGSKKTGAKTATKVAGKKTAAKTATTTGTKTATTTGTKTAATTGAKTATTTGAKTATTTGAKTAATTGTKTAKEGTESAGPGFLKETVTTLGTTVAETGTTAVVIAGTETLVTTATTLLQGKKEQKEEQVEEGEEEGEEEEEEEEE